MTARAARVGPVILPDKVSHSRRTGSGRDETFSRSTILDYLTISELKSHLTSTIGAGRPSRFPRRQAHKRRSPATFIKSSVLRQGGSPTLTSTSRSPLDNHFSPTIVGFTSDVACTFPAITT
ncbi:hypothetical protein EVAR_80675_1 [Eumeta japonica]|uniref:Uncharacterized protein n=1 Tax=Eumeta variegata TaxID=151549 RepID=A0A4C1U418_EUMVA|nr:hypothetical protein EVAR_80675_1 [Eumeta japonica]